MRPRYKWQPLRPATTTPPSEQLLADQMKYGYSRDEVLAMLAQENSEVTIWKNDLYQVARRALSSKIVHLNIRRVDGGPILRDWRHFQQIKNELLGEECEAVELYPAESRLVDTSNKYHLIGVADPAFRFPITGRGRASTESSSFADAAGDHPLNVSSLSGTKPRQKRHREILTCKFS